MFNYIPLVLDFTRSWPAVSHMEHLTIVPPKYSVFVIKEALNWKGATISRGNLLHLEYYKVRLCIHINDSYPMVSLPELKVLCTKRATIEDLPTHVSWEKIKVFR